MTLDQIKVALYLLNARAVARCEKGTREHFFYTAGVYRAVASHYGKDPGDALQYNDAQMLSHVWQQLSSKRNICVSILKQGPRWRRWKPLQVPFKIFETLDGLGSEKVGYRR
jgi:hypothetical protein